jgi:glutamate carboxypeptidase
VSLVLTERIKHLTDERDRWLTLLADMVNIDSGPGDQVGASRMLDMLRDVWSEIGCTIEVVESEPSVLLASRPGRGGRVLMIGHYDTVFPRGTVDRRPFRIQDGRGYGPGAADMKAGLVAQAACVSVLEAESCALTVLINGDEESGSVSSRALIEQEASTADLVLVFEPGEADGAVVLGRPGVRRFRVSTRGRAAHSGVEPELGRNAIEGIAHLALAIQDLGKQGDFGTITVSQISGGTRPNIVPEEASLIVDARVPSDAVGDSLVDELELLVGGVFVEEVSGHLEHLETRPAFPVSSDGNRLADLLQELGSKASIPVEGRPARGSSDGNFTAGRGALTIDGLGPPGGRFHTEDEWFDVNGVFTRAALIAGLIDELGEEGDVLSRRETG